MRAGVRTLCRIAAFAGALLLLAAALRVGASLAFPIGGGEFHALAHATSRSARAWAALQTLVAYAGALAPMAGVLVGVRYPLGAYALYVACVVVGASAWWRACHWAYPAAPWDLVCALGAVPMLLVCGAVILAAGSMRERRDARKRERQARSRRAAPQPPREP
jgi:hypothetical protein